MKLPPSTRPILGFMPALCVAVIGSVLLFGCGGSSSGSSVTVSGVAATGAAMSGATVAVMCVNGQANTSKTATDGSYSIAASGTFPCMLEASDATHKLHSVASGSGSSATANITPLTEQMVASLSSDSVDTAAFFAAFGTSEAAAVASDKLAAAQKKVLDNLAAIGVDTSALKDLIGDKLVAKTTSQSGNAYDQVLDSVAAKPVNVRLIAMNDFHGNFAPPSTSNGGSMVLPNGGAGQKVTVGGAAYLATLVKNLKAENPNSILVAAGDDISASPFESMITHDEATVDILNTIGLEVSSVGNHEFDHGSTELLRIQNGGCFPASGSQGVVGSDTCLVNGVYPGAKFKYLAANVVVTATGKTLLPATYIKRFGTVSVGFVGLTFQGTPTAVSASGVAGLEFKEESAVINQYAAKLKANGVNAVVVLIHQGGQTMATTVNDKTCPGFSGDITTIVDKLSADVDVIVSGHTHQEYVCNYAAKTAKKNILLTSTGYYGGAVSAIDLVLQPSKGMVSVNANTVPVIQADAAVNATLPTGFTSVAKDATVDALVTKYKTLSATLGGTNVGTITASINRATLPNSTTRDETAEGALGALMADTYLAGVPGGADIAFVNPGSVRADLSYTAPGTVTYSMLQTVEPFGNTLTTLNLTGAQIQSLLAEQWNKANRDAKVNTTTGGAGRLLAVSKGFTYTFDNSKIAGNFAIDGSPIVAGTLKLNGVAIDPAKSYKIVTNSFMIGAVADNFTVMATGTNITDTKMLDLDAFIAYFKANSPVSPPAPRVTRLN
ncbi:bifunctional metallophosphatase/5'-nucleotidase [Rhodoferax sp.]|uniref:bifunctional metallophosphatase/5'-nucleotidase n=1 Tax=Rhodoferax sp. TaxID=50421 RepID=UPI00283DBE51|nr:bifunctional metallophosphatase/5'-nucleotidase [Rhodoferax sp.]MDR3369124.1 bifunctional metallophosphatase/5'-nucleotidase [Rhodoferax sp.]